MIKVNPYLNFNGTTEEAFNFYKSVFGGELTELHRFSDTPGSTPNSESNRVMHVSLPIGDQTTLMGSDISELQGMKLMEGNNNYISLHPETVADGKRIFDALSKGGVVEMKYEKMFWGAYFGSFKDKFGICWMINVEDKQS